MRIPACALLGVALLVGPSCSGSVEPPVSVAAVTPEQAYNDVAVDLVIHGGPFRPAYDVDTSAGRATANPGAFTAFLTPRTDLSSPRVAVKSLIWRSAYELAAVLPDGVDAGLYDVEVRDPRGHMGALPNAFESLGKDRAAPTVTIIQPTSGTVVNAEAEVPVAIRADDGLGHLATLRWTVSSGDTAPLTGACPIVPGVPQATCRFVFVAPRPPQVVVPLNINVEALDTAGNMNRAAATLAVGFGPVVTGFVPIEGPALGGTEIVVTGSNFIAGSQAFIGGELIDPDGGILVDEHSIRGRTPAHDPGIFPLSVRTGSIESTGGTFQFVARPVVRVISPAQGREEGGTPVVVAGKFFRAGKTQILFSTIDGEQELICPTFVSGNRIEGFAPPGVGIASIWARDPVAGVGELLSAFTWVSADMFDGGVSEAGLFSGGDGGAP
jgi:IPT/TIG domain